MTKNSFGPSALATPANALTLARLLATPVLVVLIVTRGASWPTILVGTAIAGSDGIDGWVARRQGTTRSGAFLDPLADKFVVLGALGTLAGTGRLSWIPVALIGAREIWMSVYRSRAGRRGITIPARMTAKIKTVIQNLAIGTCIFPLTADDHNLQTAAIWLATVFTLGTGMQYFFDGHRAKKSLNTPSNRVVDS